MLVFDRLEQQARSAGVILSVVGLLLGLIVGPLVAVLGHSPHTGRYIVAGGLAFMCLMTLLAFLMADRKYNQPMGFDIAMILTALSFPLYFLLDGLSVPFWTRFGWSLGMFVICLIVTIWLDRRKKSRQQ